MDPRNLLSPVETIPFLNMIFLNAASTSILILDLEGNILDVNPSFEKSFRYTKDNLVGRNFSLLFIEKDKLKQLPEKELKETQETGSSNDENYIIKGGGEPTWVYGESIFFKDENGQAFIVKIIHDTQAKKLLEEELMKKNEEQEKIIQDRDIFIYTVSHDLRSPISNVQGLVNSLKENIRNPEETEWAIKMMGESIDRLKSKINELSAIGNELEDKEIQMAEVKFQEALNDVLLDLREEIKNSGAEIISDFSKVPIINFSRKNLKSILQNLVSNSVKFRSSHRRVKVVIDTEKNGEGYIILRVSDNGLGIKEEDKEKIFRMYHRLNTNIKGTGVGMTIVKRLVVNSGGRIELDSKIGEGSTFKIFLQDLAPEVKPYPPCETSR